MNGRYVKVKGYSLVELLVALLLGTFLAAGMIEIFTSLSKDYQMRDSMSRIQEDGRYVLEVMSREIRHAGYRVYPRTDTIANIFPQKDDAFTSADDLLCAASVFGTNGLPDSLIVRYQIDNEFDLEESLCRPSKDSVNDALADAGVDYGDEDVNVVLTEKFFIQDNVLYCISRVDYNDTGGVAHVIPARRVSVPILSNVENMRVLFGVDTDGPGVDEDGNLKIYDPDDAFFLPNKYVDAATVSATVLPNRGGWTDVRSIRLSVVMRSERDSISSKDNPTVTVNGGKVINIAEADQNRLFQDFSTTVMLRNAAMSDSADIGDCPP